MRFRNLSKWKLTAEIEGLLYFAQRMDELLFDFTLDSFKPPALTPASLAHEALDHIRNCEEDSVDLNGLVHIQDEIQESLQNDKISKSLLDVGIEHYLLKSDET